MTKARLAKPREPKHASALERLEPEEAHAVLRRLLAAHFELRAEVEQTAREFLCEVTFENVADVSSRVFDPWTSRTSAAGRAFIDKYVPKWSNLIARVLERV